MAGIENYALFIALVISIVLGQGTSQTISRATKGNTSGFVDSSTSRNSISEYNSGSYKNFKFNPTFNRTRVAKDGTKRLSRYYSRLLKRLEKSAAKDRSARLTSKWKSIAIALNESYMAEEGAVIYHQADDHWRYCGWVQVEHSFLPTSDPIKMCASLKAFGLPEVTRAPVPFEDYIPDDSVKGLRKQAVAMLRGKAIGGVSRRFHGYYGGRACGGGAHGPGAHCVDLFRMATDEYEERCKKSEIGSFFKPTTKRNEQSLISSILYFCSSPLDS